MNIAYQTMTSSSLVMYPTMLDMDTLQPFHMAATLPVHESSSLQQELIFNNDLDQLFINIAPENIDFFDNNKEPIEQPPLDIALEDLDFILDNDSAMPEIDILQKAIDIAEAASSPLLFNDSSSPLPSCDEITYNDLAATSLPHLGRKRSLETDDDDDDVFSLSGSSSDDWTTDDSPQMAKKHKSNKHNEGKKESNKTAASKYRLKKVREKAELFERRDALVKRNAEMKKKIDDMQTEINCIKSLLLEALIVKNNNVTGK